MGKFTNLLFISFFIFSSCNEENEPEEQTSGAYLPAHDPAKIVKDGDTYIAYYSGIESQYFNPTDDQWHVGVGHGEIESPLSFDNRPAWLDNSVVSHVNVISAPGMLDARTMYYCLADWETDDGSACIGRATATGSAPLGLEWEDAGEPVICSDAEGIVDGEPFAIDPAVFEGDNNSLWMVYGSHWSGIWIVELNPETGMLSDSAALGWSAPNSAFTRVAKNSSNSESEFVAGDIEAAFIHKQDDAYYLFVNWDKCCNGIESTYNIRIGRSTSPSGPYLDKDGVDMNQGGGTLFMETDGRFIGPGHAGIMAYAEGSETKYVFSFHFYDRDNEDEPGVGTLGTRMLTWGSDGWPVLSEETFLPTE